MERIINIPTELIVTVSHTGRNTCAAVMMIWDG